MGPNVNTIEERQGAIIRGIMSGDNACGTLKHAIDSGNGPAFLGSKITPTLQVYEDEAQQLRSDRDAFSRQAEVYRQALEYIASNARGSAPAHLEAYALRALGRN